MLVHFFYFFWVIFQIIIGSILIFPVISYLVYRHYPKKLNTQNVDSYSENDYAIIITAYKDISNIPNLINSILKLNYSNFLIYIIADDCPELIENFNDDRIVFLRPNPILKNQVKSHFYAIQNFKREHTFLTIIDSDNLIDSEYLTVLNRYINEGYQAVQGIRKAKNFDTTYACIDALNEIYYIFYDRKILFGIGSSSMLSGSGMAFSSKLYKECMENVKMEGAGFDKILQSEILKRGLRIAFAEDAIVYDEKTSLSNQLVKQRARWNNTWFRYFKFGFQLINQGLIKLNANQLLFGFVLLRPPLFLLLIASSLIMFINLFINITLSIIWLSLLTIFTLGLFFALYKSDTDQRIYKAILHIPKFIFLQILSLLKTRKANQYSVATEHTCSKKIEEF